jgi:hypothetical protein
MGPGISYDFNVVASVQGEVNGYRPASLIDQLRKNIYHEKLRPEINLESFLAIQRKLMTLFKGTLKLV